MNTEYDIKQAYKNGYDAGFEEAISSGGESECTGCEYRLDWEDRYEEGLLDGMSYSPEHKARKTQFPDPNPYVAEMWINDRNAFINDFYADCERLGFRNGY